MSPDPLREDSNPTPQTSSLLQVDYRKDPSAAGDIAQGHYDRDHPIVPPEEPVSPGPDEEILNYDLPHEPHTYNQMALGIEPREQGWSPDYWNPRR
jgi:hypothetical protein